MTNNLQTYGIQSSTGYLQSFVVVKPEDETRTNTVAITRDRDLIIPLNPYQTVYWKATLFFYGGVIAAAGNANSQWSTPAAPNAGGWRGHYQDAAGAVLTGIATVVAAAYNAAGINFLTNAAGAVYTAFFEGMLINGANGGYLSFDWSQNVLNANPSTLLKGSRLEGYLQ